MAFTEACRPLTELHLKHGRFEQNCIANETFKFIGKSPYSEPFNLVSKWLIYMEDSMAFTEDCRPLTELHLKHGRFEQNCIANEAFNFIGKSPYSEPFNLV